MGRASFLRRHWLTGVMLALFVSNVLLLRQNLHFRRMVEPDFSQFSFLQAGDTVREFTAELAGHPDGGKGWLFLYFSPSCRYSAEQVPYWNQIFSPRLLERYRAVGLFPDSEDDAQARSFLRRFGLGDLPTRSVSGEWIDRLHLHVTPMTLVLDGASQVQRNWPGRWRYETVNEALDYFGQLAADTQKTQTPDASAER